MALCDRLHVGPADTDVIPCVVTRRCGAGRAADCGGHGSEGRRDREAGRGGLVRAGTMPCYAAAPRHPAFRHPPCLITRWLCGHVHVRGQGFALRPTYTRRHSEHVIPLSIVRLRAFIQVEASRLHEMEARATCAEGRVTHLESQLEALQVSYSKARRRRACAWQRQTPRDLFTIKPCTPRVAQSRANLLVLSLTSTGPGTEQASSCNRS